MTALRTFLLALGAIVCTAADADAASPVAPPAPGRSLAVIPFYAPERMWTVYAPVVEYLRRETGEAWSLTLPATHEELIEELCAGRIDVALIGPVPLGRANLRCGAVPFLVPLGPGGAPVYESVLLTSDPAVGSIEALRGKEIGFMRGSTAAHVLPVTMLAEAGLDRASYVPVFLESQDRLMAALLARRISAAGVKSALHRRFRDEPGLRVLRTSGPLPNFAFVSLPSLPKPTRERVSAALLRLRPLERADDAALVKGWDDEIRNGFVRPPPDYLSAVLALRERTEKVLRERD